jgi:transcriptional regulator NrdR family protein
MLYALFVFDIGCYPVVYPIVSVSVICVQIKYISMASHEPSTIILKRTSGKTEPYNERKLYASIKAACLAAHRPAGEAEDTAKMVCLNVLPWIRKKQEVTSLDVRAHAYPFLKVLSPKAADIYKRHSRIMA